MTLVRQIEEVRGGLHALEAEVHTAIKLTERHEEQISGERGILAAIREMTDEMRGFKRALWGGGISVLTGTIIFSISLLAATGQL